MTVLKTLLLLSASGSVLGLVLTLARRLCGRRMPSTLWYYAWLPVLLRLVLPLPGLIPQTQTAAESTAVPAAAQTADISRYTGSHAGIEDTVFIGEAAAETTDAAAWPAGPAAPAETAGGTEAAPQTPLRLQAGAVLKSPALWLGIWLAGAVLYAARYTAGYIRFRRALIKTLRTTDGTTARVYAAMPMMQRPRLFRSAYVKTPMLLGLRLPLIILPDIGFSEESARNILRHELTHFRRGDLYVKWLFVLVSSLHWFNPLMPLFRQELDRVCELSCDENVLTRMMPSERRSYGETLLDLAANHTLPAGVVATTFATEKRTLKERLEQIMKFDHKPRAVIALTVAAMLLVTVIALAAAPARASSAPSAEASADVTTVSVSTADELLAAIAPNTDIRLEAGTYDLSTASDYGKASDSPWYHWEEVYDGYELVIEGVSGLTVTAVSGDAASTILSAGPRYADVLEFSHCSGITLAGFTAGHTIEPGQCAGGVIHLVSTDDVSITGCSLYGCGVLGVYAEYGQNILVSETEIYECSFGAVELMSCRNVRFDACDLRDCSERYDGVTSPVYSLIDIMSCSGVAVTDCHVYGNYAMELMAVSYSQEVCLLGTLFENNTLESRGDYGYYAGTVFRVEGSPVTVAGCEFRDDAPAWESAADVCAVDTDGSSLSADDLAAMKRAHVDFDGFAERQVPTLDRTLGADGRWEIHVSTVDEFLAAIAPDTVIYLDEGLFDLTEAADYGTFGGQYYYWIDMYDGPGLVISGADNLSIVGAGKDATRIEALPRYASVIGFSCCRNVSVSGLTAGHTLGAGMCAGAVLEFEDCMSMTVEDCGLFGCGIYGVWAMYTDDITVTGCEIYECSYGAVSLDQCAGAVFENNDIHDCAWPTYDFYECADITVDGQAVTENTLNVDGAGPYRSADER